MELDQAIAAHAEWKMRFRTAMMRKEKLDVNSIERDDCCGFGKWLRTEGDERFSDHPRYIACKRLHAAFHHEAGRVAREINAGEYAHADSMLQPGSAYARVLADTGAAIVALKREVVAAA